MVDPHLEDRHRELAARVRELGERELRAVARDERDPCGRAAEVAARLAEAGLLRSAVPPPFGLADARSALVVRERLAYFSLLSESVFAAQALAAQLVAAEGSELQRSRWLPALADGSAHGAVAVTEPEAGSDHASIRCTARPDGALWRLDGVKTWVSTVKGASLLLVLARSSEGEGTRGLSLFLADGDAPGLAQRPVETTAALPVVELRLAAVPAVLLGAEGRGLRPLLQCLAYLRPGAAGAACGLAARALDEALRHSLTRRQFGRPLAAFQATRLLLAQLHAELEAARRLARHAAWLVDAGAEHAGREAAAARVFAADAAEHIADASLRLHGAAGLVRGSSVERLFREARALRLREGTSEMLRLELADSILKESR